MTSESFVARHRPEEFDTIQGHNKALQAIQNWAEHWSKGDKPQLMVGPPGVGKTVTAEVVCEHMGWNMNPINASDKRTSDDLSELATTLRSSPYENKQLCLLDEIDSIPGNANITPLVSALKDAPCPVMLTANDEYSIPGKVKRACTQHDFKLGKRSRKAKLKKVVKKEDIDLSPRDLERLSERPDLRSALNDLQRFSESDSDNVDFDQREWEQNEFDAVGEQLKGESDAEIGNSLKPDDFIYWLDENWRNNLSDLDKQLRGIEVSVGYDTLSRADVYLERAEQEDYRFWKYANALMEMMGETRITEPYGNWIDKSFPSWFRQKQRKMGDGTAEDELYQALSNTEKGTYGIGGDYTYFRKILLPILQDLDKETRMEIALSSRVEGKGLKALNITESEFEEWRGGEWEESDTTSFENSGMDW